jgi:AraC family transcriptional regulator
LTHRVDAPGFSLAEVRDVEGLRVERHTHDEAHFCVVLDEGYRSSARGLDDLCSRGTLLHHPAGTTHEDRFLRPGGRFLVLKPVPDAPLPAEGLPPTSVAFQEPRVRVLCEKLALEARRSDLSSTLALECLHLELVGIVAGVTSPRRRPSWIDGLLSEIQDSPGSTPSVEALASGAGVHPVALARAFRRHVGMSPGDVLRWARLQRVLPELARSRRGLAELALEAGYSDQSAFTRACRRMLGVTPGRYRQHMRPVPRSDDTTA